MIIPAAAEHIPAVRTSLEEYGAWLGDAHLCIQSFSSELAGLPGAYAPPPGALLVATGDDSLAGCVALRRLDDATCEMKRLYLRPAYRGSGLGRRLAEAIVDEGRRLGYARMRLDSMPGVMDAAIRVYEAIGFRDIPPYMKDPIPGARFLEIALK